MVVNLRCKIALCKAKFLLGYTLRILSTNLKTFLVQQVLVLAEV